jgi:hypothetical protein
MDVAHTVKDHISCLLNALKRSHYGDSVPLDHYIAPGDHLNRLQCGPICTNQTLSTLNEPFLVTHDTPNFHDFTVDFVM